MAFAKGKKYIYCQVCAAKMVCTYNSPFHQRACSNKCWDEYQLRETRCIINKDVVMPEGFEDAIEPVWDTSCKAERAKDQPYQLTGYTPRIPNRGICTEGKDHKGKHFDAAAQMWW